MTRLRALVLSSVLAALPAAADPASRIVSVGGSVTEIVYALGQESRLVARDSTSSYPEAAQDLPDVGYVRRLSAEGLLSVDPDLILVEDGAGPPEALDLIAKTEIPVVTIPMGFDRQAVLTAAPDAILLMQARGDADVAQAKLLAHPAIAATPAGRDAAVIRMNGMLLLGFSVRTGQAVTELAAGLRDLAGKT